MNMVAGNEFMTSLQESLGTVKVILGFGAQEKNKNLIREKFSKTINASIKTAVFDSGLQSVVISFATVGLASVFFISRSFGIPLSEIAIIFFSFARVSVKVGQIIKEKTLLDRSLPSLGQVDEIRKRAVELKQTSGSIPFKVLEKNISIRNLTFSYTEHEPALKNISMDITRGEMVAIVGESGSGKSTLIDVIMGFNDPDSGMITIDDIPLHEYDINSYRGRIGYVPQESVLFNMTIAENIGWANEKALIQDIKHACQSANADSFIESFPDQYDTHVGDRGVRLSGGQLQRVALARAMIRRPVILILDEATSSLDTKSERQIQEAIEKIAMETTIIVIAHRLSTILKADQIYVLEKGKIIENGGYQKLLKNNSLFSQMVKSQDFTNNILK
jgi:ABC-type multidrug transport system fused ATPase/permease subunit